MARFMGGLLRTKGEDDWKREAKIERVGARSKSAMEIKKAFGSG